MSPVGFLRLASQIAYSNHTSVTDALRYNLALNLQDKHACTCSPMLCSPSCSLQARERALFEAQHGAARIAAEAAGPVYLHARPPLQPPVRPARVSYTALLSRFRQDAAANRMSSFRDPAGSDSDPESTDVDGPASDDVACERTQQPGCRVCRSVDLARAVHALPSHTLSLPGGVPLQPEQAGSSWLQCAPAAAVASCLCAMRAVRADPAAYGGRGSTLPGRLSVCAAPHLLSTLACTQQAPHCITLSTVCDSLGILMPRPLRAPGCRRRWAPWR